MKEVIHLKTQRNQPYGSVRLSCERCGVILIGDAPRWVDSEKRYESLPVEFVRCDRQAGA
jgi:hypothetical protein